MMDLSNEIATERLELKVMTPTFDNAEKLLEIVNNNQEHFYFLYGFVEYTTPEEMYDFLARRQKAGNHFFGIFKKNGDRLVGSISARKCDDKAKKVEVGYFLDEAFVGQGFTTEAFKALKAELFDKGCRKIIATVDVPNIKSHKVCEACGMQKEAVLIKEKLNRHTKEFDDLMVYYILNE